MAFKMSIIPYMGIRFLAIAKPFLANRAEFFFGNSGDYLLDRLVMRNLDLDAF